LGLFRLLVVGEMVRVEGWDRKGWETRRTGGKGSGEWD
jgi:hypothetical protein